MLKHKSTQNKRDFLNAKHDTIVKLANPYPRILWRKLQKNNPKMHLILVLYDERELNKHEDTTVTQSGQLYQQLNYNPSCILLGCWLGRRALLPR